MKNAPYEISRDPLSTPSKDRIAGYMSLCTARPNETYTRNYRLNKMLIKEMASYCRNRGIEFLLVCINTLMGCDDEEKYKAIDPTFESGFFDGDLRAHADSLDIRYLGLEEAFWRHCRETGKSWYWSHWNYAGHRAVSAELRDPLESVIRRR